MWNVVTCILCMDFAMAMYVLLLKDTKGVFPIEGFTRIHQTLHDTGSLLSVAVQSEREVVRTINTRENILQMVQKVRVCPPVEWPLASAYHVCRCG